MKRWGDIRQLQHEQLRRRKASTGDDEAPLQAPTSMKNRDLDTLPGGVSFVQRAWLGCGCDAAVGVGIGRLLT